jgi:hypothetical protein
MTVVIGQYSSLQGRSLAFNAKSKEGVVMNLEKLDSS